MFCQSVIIIGLMTVKNRNIGQWKEIIVDLEDVLLVRIPESIVDNLTSDSEGN